MPLLSALFTSIGVFGGYLIGVVFIGVDQGAFWSQMQGSVDFRYDVWNNLGYVVDVLREATALAYYRLRGWIA